MALSDTKYLPAEGVPWKAVRIVATWSKRYYNGWVVACVLPLNKDREVTRGHRMQVVCPICGKITPAGRIAQHYRIHPDVSEAAYAEALGRLVDGNGD